MKTLNIAAVAAVFILCGASFCHAEMQFFKRTKGWVTSYSLTNKVCLSKSDRNYQGSHLIVRVPVIAEEGWQIGIINNNWLLKSGRNYPITVYIDKRPILSGDALAATNQMMLIYLKNGPHYIENFVTKFKEGHTMVWQGQDQKSWFTAIGLHGTYDAIDTINECLSFLLSRLRHQKKPGRFFPRHEALSVVHERMRILGITGYKIEPQKNQFVEVTLPDGSKTLFIASFGNSSDADDILNKMVSDQRKSCDGDFATNTKKVPTTDGSKHRFVNTFCSFLGTARSVIIEIISSQNGLVATWLTYPAKATSAKKPASPLESHL